MQKAVKEDDNAWASSLQQSEIQKNSRANCWGGLDLHCRQRSLSTSTQRLLHGTVEEGYDGFDAWERWW